MIEQILLRDKHTLIVNTSQGEGSRLASVWRKVRHNVVGTALVLFAPTKGSLYLSVNAGSGMWMSTATVVSARLRRRLLVAHHHSYDYISTPTFRSRSFFRLAGPQSIHVVLSSSMATDLGNRYPQIEKIAVLNNSGLIDQRLRDSSASPARPTIGHLSNLTESKGVMEVVDVAIATRAQGLPVRLILAGPITDDTAARAVERATSALQGDFEYWGPIHGERKRQFYQSISHFVFPSRYRNEASPLVLFEALASGLHVIASSAGAISDVLGAHGGRVVADLETFADQGQAWIAETWSSPLPVQDALDQFDLHSSRYRLEIEQLMTTLDNE